MMYCRCGSSNIVNEKIKACLRCAAMSNKLTIIKTPDVWTLIKSSNERRMIERSEVIAKIKSVLDGKQ